MHVRDLTPRNASGALRLEVRIDDRDPAASTVADWLSQLACTGVHVARRRAAL